MALFATDLASRGLDVPDVDWVIQYVYTYLLYWNLILSLSLSLEIDLIHLKTRMSLSIESGGVLEWEGKAMH